MGDLETTYTPLQGLEVRSVGDRHVLEGICVPYDAPTLQAGPRPEIFVMGAFRDLVASVARKVRLIDYNHSRSRISVGTATALEERSQGLWGRFQMHRTPEGEGAFANVQEGVYSGLSIGFKARAEEDRAGVRAVTSAWLDHVSLVEEPAYKEAIILATRGTDSDVWAQYRAAMQPAQVDVLPDVDFTQLMARFRSR